MKLSFCKMALVAGCLCFGKFSVHAAKLKPADVKADPTWLAHLDCDALRPTTIGKYILAEMDKPESKAKMEDFQAAFNVDLRTQLHGVTLYGTETNADGGVMIVYADFDANRLADLAREAKEYQNSRHNSVLIHSWIDEKRKDTTTEQVRTYAAIQEDRVIFSHYKDEVILALDVISGSAANLKSGNPFPELDAFSGNRFIEAAARKVKLPETNPNAAVLKLSKTVQIVAGETKEQFQGTMTLIAKSDEVAVHILSVVEGLASLMKLQTEKPESAKLAKALHFKQEGSRVVGNLSMPASEAVEIMKADAARKKAKKASK